MADTHRPTAFLELKYTAICQKIEVKKVESQRELGRENECFLVESG